MVSFMLVLSQDVTTLSDGTVYKLLKDFSLPLLALIWGVYTYWRQSRKKLSIRQVGHQYSDRIVSVEVCMTSLAVEMAITNDSPQASIVIAYYDVELPWNEPNLDPLDDPENLDLKKPLGYYSPPGFGLQVDRDRVLNHRRYQNGKLAAGEAIRGHFLAKGEMQIPTDLTTNNSNGYIDAVFVVQDTTGKEYKTPIHLYF
jgi:hypothetical protein